MLTFAKLANYWQVVVAEKQISKSLRPTDSYTNTTPRANQQAGSVHVGKHIRNIPKALITHTLAPWKHMVWKKPCIIYCVLSTTRASYLSPDTQETICLPPTFLSQLCQCCVCVCVALYTYI